MKKRSVLAVGVLLSVALAWTAIAQPPAGGGFGRMREAQQNALTALQEQVAKLKAMTEQAQQAMQGRNFQDMTDDERTKMREEFTKRREEQAKIMASMQQQMDILKGGRQLMVEHQESLAPLKDLLASAQGEKATATAAKIEKLIAERQKQFDDKMAAMGYTPEMLERMSQRRGPQ
ncbi:MAG: hypothetical protein ABFE13_17195 [Phycisphaerales bacterium]